MYALNRTRAWAEWFHGKTPEEIGAESGFSVGGVCAMIAEVICREMGGWGQVKKELRLRAWARTTEGKARTMIRKKQMDFEIERRLQIGSRTAKAIRSFLAPERIRKRGPQIRGRRLAMLEACYRFGLGASRAGKICEIPASTARSVYRRIASGKPLNSGHCYIYHNDGTGLEEVVSCDE